jgi:hypothetical protein
MYRKYAGSGQVPPQRPAKNRCAQAEPTGGFRLATEATRELLLEAVEDQLESV